MESGLTTSRNHSGIAPYPKGVTQYMGVMDDWSQKQSSVDFPEFRPCSIRSLMGLDLSGLLDVVRKYKKPMIPIGRYFRRQ